MSNNGKDFSSKADLIKQIYEKFEKGGLSKMNQQTIVTLTLRKAGLMANTTQTWKSSGAQFLPHEQNNPIEGLYDHIWLLAKLASP